MFPRWALADDAVFRVKMGSGSAVAEASVHGAAAVRLAFLALAETFGELIIPLWSHDGPFVVLAFPENLVAKSLVCTGDFFGLPFREDGRAGCVADRLFQEGIQGR